MFAGNFAPLDGCFARGQLLPISENETLFQLIGTTYGGDGQSPFALPDLRGRIPIHQGNGFILAETGGARRSR
jgi:microcystin-dependent protein